MKIVVEELDDSRKETREFKGYIDLLEAGLSELQREINIIQESIIDQDNWSRRNCLEIEGITQGPGKTIQTLEENPQATFRLNLHIN